MQTDVKSASNTVTSTFYAGPTRLKGVLATANATAGTVVFKDGGESGASLFTVTFPANATNNPLYIALPGEGIRFSTSLFANLTAVNSVTAIYG